MSLRERVLPRLAVTVRAPRFHYAWVVTAVTFVALLAASSVRAAPGVFLVPLENEFGWSRSIISLAISISIITFGLGGPIGGVLVDRIGPRRGLLGGLVMIAVGLYLLLSLHDLWQLYLLWGVLIGVGTGISSAVMGATVAHRWFRTHRGVVIGLFGAATSVGQLIFVPWMLNVTTTDGWRSGIALVLGASIAAAVPVLFFMRDRPSDVGARAFGEGEVVSAEERAADVRRTPLAAAVRTRDFWLLAGSFFICGYTSNGLVGTHLIPHAMEHGFTAVTSGAAVGLMGSMNIVGTLASGWLSDRFDNRKLLAVYYGFRALSLMALPLIYEEQWLYAFAVLYGLDWIATVPPTANLTAQIFGRASLGQLYGWIFFSHMCGAALAAFAGAFAHDILGNYHIMFVSAAMMGFIAVSLALRISPARDRVPTAVAPASASY